MKQWALDKIKSVWEWYKARPTWQKFFLWIVLVVVVVLVVVAALGVLTPTPKKPSHKKPDAAHSDMVDSTINTLDEDNAELKAGIEEKKKELAVRLNQARKIDATTVKDRDRISKARTMEELDRLQEELDL